MLKITLLIEKKGYNCISDFCCTRLYLQFMVVFSKILAQRSPAMIPVIEIMRNIQLRFRHGEQSS